MNAQMKLAVVVNGKKYYAETNYVRSLEAHEGFGRKDSPRKIDPDVVVAPEAGRGGMATLQAVLDKMIPVPGANEATETEGTDGDATDATETDEAAQDDTETEATDEAATDATETEEAKADSKPRRNRRRGGNKS